MVHIPRLQPAAQADRRPPCPAVRTVLQGRADLGFWAVVKMFPLAIGLTALAKWIVDGGFHER